MSKNRKVNRNRSAKSQRGSILPFITGLAIGLFIAFVVYLKMSAIKTSPQGIEGMPTEKDVQSGEGVPAEKPKFDFYTILPEREVKVPEWEPPKPKNISNSDELTAGRGSYVFQVGSFQKLSDADSVKAKLVMLGLPVEIQRVVINGQKVWFRVRVGPYKDPSKLDIVRRRLSSNNLDYILLRIKDDA